MDVNKEAEASDFYKKYPFYSKVVIPKGIYPGQTAEVATFQDSTLWIANKDVDAELVYKALAQAAWRETGILTATAATPPFRLP